MSAPREAPADLRGKILRKCRESMSTKEQFFTENADRIAECCAALARAFDKGARLFVMGNGGSSCDAAHVAVEFMHPIIEKRPALARRQGAWAVVTQAGHILRRGHELEHVLRVFERGRLAVID